MYRGAFGDLRHVDVCGIVIYDVPVAQWIERRSPEPSAQVRFLSGTLFMYKPYSARLPGGFFVVARRPH